MTAIEEQASTNAVLDTGTGYGRPRPESNERLTRVGPGTPMGELLRRYWQPAARSEEATSTPKRVRLLGEDLILFRDSEGRAGLVSERCAHRGTSLFFGRVEDDGIRCCYHGWKYDVEGHCLDQATEVDGGQRREAARLPWYPVLERYGLVFAYMGPPEKKPMLPRWAALENVPEGRHIEISTHPGFGPDDGILPCNWLQAYENGMDQMHVFWLHFMHSGTQFYFENEDLPLLDLPPDFPLHGMVNGTTWNLTDEATTATSLLPHPTNPGEFYEGTVACMFPNSWRVPGFDEIAWVVPVDDTHHRLIQIGVVQRPGEMAERTTMQDGREWRDLSEEELQRFPGDYEAQTSQGPITLHSEEHLAASDQGVVMLRRGLHKQLDDLEAGKDPAGISYDPNEAPRVPPGAETNLPSPSKRSAPNKTT